MKQGKSLLFLVVDDEAIVRKTLTKMLEYCGHTAHSVGDGISGREALVKTSYDAAIVDIRMPGLDGIHLLRWAREYRLNLPIIIMSGHATQGTCDEAMASGAFAFIDKPFRLKVIKHIIAEIQKLSQ